MRRDCSFVYPGDWQAPTGGYRYDRRIVQEMQGAGWQVETIALGDGYPRPDAGTCEAAGRRIAAIADGRLVVTDGLAFGALPDLVQREAARLRWVALVHHPLHLETGADDAARAALRDGERQAPRCARRVIVTSAATASDVERMGVPADRIHIVEPGTDPAAARPAPRRLDASGPRLLCVATLTPRKGHAVLLQALAGLQALPWTLHNVGSADRDADTAAGLRRLAVELGMAERVHWHGEVDDAALSAHYAAADLFVLPSFHEGYGMALAEALAHGLPAITTTAVALAQALPPAAMIAVSPGDAAALHAALARLIGDADERAARADAARRAGSGLPTWAQAAARFAAVLEGAG